MRNEARIENNIEVVGIQGYHGGNWNSESYAFEGFESNKYFASDRPIKLNANMERPDGQPLCGVGLEQEVELFGDLTNFALAELMSKVIFPLFPHDLYKMQHDGSLGHDARDDGEENAVGVECITQVMTKAFVRNHYKDWKTMYNTYFPAFNISASKSGRCGMHVNISNAMFGRTREEQIEAIRKLHYIVNRHFEMACRLFNRDPGQTGYCAQMSYSNARRMSISGGSHYVCLNYSHFETGRIELRLVGGQKNYGSFRNTMEAVFFLVERVRKISWDDLDDVAKIFKGCNQYVFDRLQSKCNLSSATLDKIRENVKREDLL